MIIWLLPISIWLLRFFFSWGWWTLYARMLTSAGKRTRFSNVIYILFGYIINPIFIVVLMPVILSLYTWEMIEVIGGYPVTVNEFLYIYIPHLVSEFLVVNLVGKKYLKKAQALGYYKDK